MSEKTFIMKHGLNICQSLVLGLVLLFPLAAAAQQGTPPGAALSPGLALLPGTAAAQDEPSASPAPSPELILKPAKTSSPRDTLRSFITNMEIVYEGLRDGGSENLLIARRRALDTMDFSGGVNYDWVNQGGRAVYLKEVLDRTALPAWEDIPDAAQVRSEGISRWTIPDTRLVISRVEDGERDGEYLFSAATIAELHLTYRIVKDRPYLPGATEGLLERVQNFASDADETELARRLAPIDTSNPRALFEQFLVSVNAAYRLVMAAEEKSRTAEGLSKAEAIRIDQEAQEHLNQAIATLDLSETAGARRKDVGIETVLKLKEIFDRGNLPSIEAIAGLRASAAMREAGSIPQWSFPGTSITIAELQEGPNAGTFRFTNQTVEEVPGIYSQVEDLRYRQPPEESSIRDILEAQFLDAGTSPGFFEYYESMPGSLVPAASTVWPLVKRLPDSLKTVFQGQTLWQWIGMALALLFLMLGFVLLNGLGELVNHYFRDLGASWVKILLPLLSASLVYGTTDFVDDALNTTGIVSAVVNTLSAALITLFMAAAALRLTIAFAESLVALPRFEDREFDASLVRVTARILGFFVAVVIAVNGFSQLGLEIMPLIAGLGVGGLAVALAVRPTLENMIGGLIIYADKPVQVGDFCKFGDQKGTVEGIGLRSTRIRALDRSLITVPNSVFADMQIVNLAHCDTLLISTVIGVRYETSMDQLRNIMAKMRQICFAHPKIETETLRVRFGAFGASSLDINVRVYALTNEWNEFHAIREDLFIRFADAIEAAGSSVAFPSTTVYMGEDEALDDARKRAAEAEVAQWREADELPFPNTPEYLAAQITDTLDYPPTGSAQAAGKRAALKTAEEVHKEDYDEQS